MKPALPVLLLLLASQAGAQGFVSMGRLFTTPDERVRLDTQRNQAAPAGSVPQAPGPAAGGAAWTGGLQAPAMDAAPGCPPGAAPGCPPAAAPGMAGTGGAAGAVTDAGAGAAQGAAEPEQAGLRLGGVIRRSNGPTMIIVNGEAQPAPAGGVTRGTVTLQADGRPVVLKPGQRYDPATGEVHEAAR
ncbi:hypothetical protein [Pseudoduganella sp. HUAS MS19]